MINIVCYLINLIVNKFSSWIWCHKTCLNKLNRNKKRKLWILQKHLVVMFHGWTGSLVTAHGIMVGMKGAFLKGLSSHKQRWSYSHHFVKHMVTASCGHLKNCIVFPSCSSCCLLFTRRFPDSLKNGHGFATGCKDAWHLDRRCKFFYKHEGICCGASLFVWPSENKTRVKPFRNSRSSTKRKITLSQINAKG